MMRHLLAVLFLLRAGTALAAPFDTYQLIMWQERTPQQVEGLARLGFTGTKLRATGGQIDPAELATHIASGLPWFLENIATDFYAPYHRYVPGKSVTWLFDEAKARRRRDPADATVFFRDPSLSDPAWQQRVDDRLAQIVTEQSRYHPLFYNMADESGIGDLAAAWDADISPPSLAAMRDWLKTQYPSLAALNAEWATAFASWDAVKPMLTDAALTQTDGNYAAWGDFKTWMDVAFARAVRSGTDAVHRADPSALAALEGGQLPGWGRLRLLPAHPVGRPVRDLRRGQQHRPRPRRQPEHDPAPHQLRTGRRRGSPGATCSKGGAAPSCGIRATKSSTPTAPRPRAAPNSRTWSPPFALSPPS